MPPIRRYLRITKQSVLECRIYLDNPADVHRWLLNTASPVLPRVINSVRPLVLPKLREENSRAKSGKGGKKKGWKDVVVEDDFEVAVFLTEVSARHTLLRKEKRAKSEKARLGTDDRRLTDAGSLDMPWDVDNASEHAMLREESQDESRTSLRDIPMVDNDDGEKTNDPTPGSEQNLFVSDDSADEGIQKSQPAGGDSQIAAITTKDVEEDKKKMALNTTYDGFSIYGRILCLVVKRRGGAKGKPTGGTGQAMMEEWISSTQIGEAQLVDD